jgi:GT2 family glycosyltransferase
VLADLRDHHPTLDVVVVDDGSTDRTAAVAAEGGATVLSLPFNLGIGGRCAPVPLRGAAWLHPEVQPDADGQHDSGEIATLFAALDAGADMASATLRGVRATYRFVVWRRP